MTTTILPRLPMTKAIRSALSSGLGDVPVGLGRIPSVDDSGTLARAPYAVLYPLDTAGLAGPPFSAPDADARWLFQVSLASDHVDQLEWLRDRCIRIFLARVPGGFDTPFTAVGMKAYARELIEDTGIPIESGLPVVSDLRFAVTCTPA